MAGHMRVTLAAHMAQHLLLARRCRRDQLPVPVLAAVSKRIAIRYAFEGPVGSSDEVKVLALAMEFAYRR